MTLAVNSFTRNLHLLTITVLLLVSFCRPSLVSTSTFIAVWVSLCYVYQLKYYNDAYHSKFSWEPVLCPKL